MINFYRDYYLTLLIFRIILLIDNSSFHSITKSSNAFLIFIENQRQNYPNSYIKINICIIFKEQLKKIIMLFFERLQALLLYIIHRNQKQNFKISPSSPPIGTSLMFPYYCTISLPFFTLFSFFSEPSLIVSFVACLHVYTKILYQQKGNTGLS